MFSASAYKPIQICWEWTVKPDAGHIS